MKWTNHRKRPAPKAVLSALGLITCLAPLACSRPEANSHSTFGEVANHQQAETKLLEGRDLLEVYQTSPDFDERYWSIWYLGEKGSVEEMIGLIHAAANEPVMEPVVAMALQKANFRMRSKDLRAASIVYAEGLLDGTHRPAVERESMILLVKLNSRGSIPAIYKVLDRRPKWTIRQLALETIGALDIEEGKNAARRELGRMEEERGVVERLIG